MQETIYVGLNLGSSVCQQTVMSGDGVRRFSRAFATSEKSLRTAFDKAKAAYSFQRSRDPKRRYGSETAKSWPCRVEATRDVVLIKDFR